VLGPAAGGGGGARDRAVAGLPGAAGILRVGGRCYALALLVQDGDGAAMERGITDVAAATYRALAAR
jgi:hypothetical protein